ncbi:MAG TPA: ketosynthase [Xanthomonadaceae bacterium]|nr:ketosynthase [Xanthomonadaceae bacterium]
MSSSTAPPEAAATGGHRAALLRVALVVAYFVLAHVAGVRHAPALAALASGDIVAIGLLSPLLAGRAWAWAALALCAWGLFRLAAGAHAFLPLLLVPVAILSLVGWSFARTLRPGREPLITRIVGALDGVPPAQLAPELRRYTRTLTRLWALLLGTLALLNLVLAALAVPNGLLAGFGIAPPLAVSAAQWSWIANVGNYGLLAGFMLLEFRGRQRRFPGRYHGFFDFLRRMGRLGPGFWANLFR